MSSSFKSFFDGCIEYSNNEKQSDTLTLLPTCRGVIFFTDQNDQPIQLLSAANIRSTARAKLLKPQEQETITKKAKLHEIVKNIYYRCCYCQTRTMVNLYNLAQKIYPHNLSEVLELPNNNFIRINPSAKWPNFSFASNLKINSSSIYFGPMPTRKAAAKLIDVLRQSLQLCKKPDLVDDPEKAKTCTYLQMETCPAPCVGNLEYESYRKLINLATLSAAGNNQHAIDYLNQKMKDAAASLDFETAARIKKQLELIQSTNSPDYRWLNNLENIKILHIDTSAKIKIKGQKKKTQTYAALLFQNCSFNDLGDFTIDKAHNIVDKIAKSEAKEPQKNLKTAKNDSYRKNDMLSILSYFLFRSKKPGLWVDLTRTALTTETLENKILTTFDNAGSDKKQG